MKFIKLQLLIVLCSLLYSEAYKILYLAPLASRSHKNVFDPVIHELASRGHDVTVFSPYKSSKPNTKNVHDIILDISAIMKDPSFTKSLFDNIGINPIWTFFSFRDMLVSICEMYLSHPEFKELMKQKQQFDAVVVSSLFNDCAFATAPHFGKNIMLHTTSGLVTWLPFFVPQPPSYVPNLFLPYTDKMSFFQRINNVAANLASRAVHDYYILPAAQKVISKHISENPSVYEVRNKVSLILTNVDPVLMTPRPTMPNIINAGGGHCKISQPLSKEFEEFVNSVGEEGFIIFSLGSNAESRYLPKNLKTSFLTTFAKLKQKVLWKYEEDLEGLPTNVKITKWMPQQDLLGSGKVKLFITHGGLLSLQESVYHGVPLVVIPLFADQPANAARLEDIGIGRTLNFLNISVESVSEVIQDVLKDKRYSENAEKYSAIFRDQPQRPEKRAAFWIEYVIRHDGAKHFRSPGEDLNFFQYFLLDVIALLGAISLGVIAAVIIVLKIIMRLLFSNKKSEKLVKKKKQ